MAGRKPVHLTSADGQVSGRQAVWQAIRMMQGDFTLHDLCFKTKEEKEAMRPYLDALVKAGILQYVGKRMTPTSFSKIRPAPQLAKVYKLIKDVGVDAPKVKSDGTPCTQGLAREQMWRTMSLITNFTPRDLAATASTPEVVVDPRDAADYLAKLLGAGYLQVVRKSKPGTQAVYRLIKNTGPKPPMVQRMKTVFDQNLGKVMWIDGAKL